jgi:serine/threonine protein kinase
MGELCPQSGDWRLYIRGESSEKQTQILEDHLHNCEVCQRTLERLADEPDSTMKLLAEAIFAVTEGGSIPHITPPNVPSPNSKSPIHDSHPAMFSMQESSWIRDYQIMESIGQGGMGTVFRAMHVRMEKLVAIKVLKSDRIDSPEAIARFKRETKLVAKLEHPNIVRALDAGEHDGRPYFVMEFVVGLDLSRLVRRIGPLPVPEACQIVRLASIALQFAHDQKIIHRDVKPSNLMITADGNVKLLDLGLAQIIDLTPEEAISRFDQAVGTLQYMAPEQRSGSHPITQQSDIFSLGVTLHELLTGQRPFERPGQPPLLTDLKNVRPDADPQLGALIKEMIASEPEDRPSAMRDIEARLGSIAPPADLTALVAEYYRWNTRASLSTNVNARPVPTETPAEDAIRISKENPSDATQSIMTGSSELIPRSDSMMNGNSSKWANLGITNTFANSLLLCTAALALSGLALTLANQSGWFQGKQIKLEPITIVPTEKIQVKAVGDVASQMLKEGRVTVDHLETGEGFLLNEELVSLPIGRYKFRFDAPVDLQQNGKEFEVAPKSTNIIAIEAKLTQPFQNPDLPNKAGLFGSYYGSVGHAGWAKKEPITFNLKLEIIAVETELNAPVTKWLVIEALVDGSNDGSPERYEEIAYLRIDSKRWDIDRRLEIYDGWVEAKSASIRQFMNQKSENARKSSIIVPFESNRDRLNELKETAKLPLPNRRLSVHDFISLFFGDESVSVAAEPIRQLRASLSKSGTRNSWLEDFHANFGSQSCYVVGSRKRGDDTKSDGYSIIRSKSDNFNPFGFLKLEVNSPSLTANCVLKNAGETAIDSTWSRQGVKRLREDVFVAKVISADVPALPEVKPPGEESSIKSPWTKMPCDLAMIPEKPEFNTWIGNISIGSRKMESIEATARMLGSEVENGRKFLWIEVEVKSSMESAEDHWEAARVLIDADEYHERRKFVIKRGWVAFGNKDIVFRIPADLKLESLTDLRLVLDPQSQFDRIGVVDIFSMLFGADLKPKTSISSLRPIIAGLLAGRERTSESVEHKLKDGEFKVERWSSPILSPVKYSIMRSPEFPFGFVSVNLSIPLGKIEISLEVDSKRGQLPSDFSVSVFGSATQLESLVQKNGERYRSMERPDWRLWTWTRDSKTYKVWAEFGGLINPSTTGGVVNLSAGSRFVLLCKTTGNEVLVPLEYLSPFDHEYIQKGRVWDSMKTHGPLMLEKTDEINKLFTFASPESPVKKWIKNYPMGDLTSVDRKFLERRRIAERKPITPAQMVESWDDFATNVK